MKLRVRVEFYIFNTGLKDAIEVEVKGKDTKTCLHKAVSQVNKRFPQARGNAWYSAYTFV
jgi:hypothetical protein